MNQIRSPRRFLAIGLFVLLGLLSAQCTRPAPSPQPVAGIANPASVFCEKQGGTLDIRQDASGGAYGVCVFPDGSECEEWAFLRGECVPGGTATPVAEAPATLTMAPPSATPPPPTDTPEPPTDMPIVPTVTPMAPATTAVPDTATPAPGPTQPPPPTDTVPPTPMPDELAFTRTSFTVQGHLRANEIRDFPLSGREGQLVMLRLGADNPEAFLTIYAVGGAQPLAPVAPGSVQWYGLLPATQSYIIKAGSPGDASNFQLVVTLPQAIRFDPGATSATIEGQINSGETVDYVLRAFQGQTMEVKASSPKGDVLLAIYALMSDEPLIGPVPAVMEWKDKLPADGDYLLKIIAGGPATDYVLDVTIQ